MPSHLVAPFLSALLAAAGGPARAEAPQPAEALLAKAKAAAGGDAWNRVRTIHARGRLRTSGLEGTVEAFDDLERGRFVLKPENPAYPVIRPEGALEIFGVMVGLVRKI